MKAFKSQCSVFKDLYRAFSEGEVEEETRIWMEQHKKDCTYCSDWSKSVDENREDKIDYEAVEDGKFDEDKRVIKKVKIIMALGIGLIAFMAVWMSVWLSD